jgi:Tfp pilus assembly protein PilO
MKRHHILLAVLGSVLLLAAFWMLLWQPKQEEIATVRADTDRIESQTAAVQVAITELRQVREDAPQIQAELVALRNIVPEGSELPSVLRQLQKAADDANLTLVSVVPSRPEAVTVEGGTEGLASISTAIDVQGGYYQIVDFLRRMEDPEISPRGLLINSASISGDPEEYPLIRVTLQGEVFAILPIIGNQPPAVTPPADEAEAADTEAESEGADVADGAEVEQ